eukprot:scaffold906_cov186-Alexandrium_tamarense.AAC.36
MVAAVGDKVRNLALQSNKQPTRLPFRNGICAIRQTRGGCLFMPMLIYKEEEVLPKDETASTDCLKDRDDAMKIKFDYIDSYLIGKGALGPNVHLELNGEF